MSLGVSGEPSSANGSAGGGPTRRLGEKLLEGNNICRLQDPEDVRVIESQAGANHTPLRKMSMSHSRINLTSLTKLRLLHEALLIVL